METNSPNVYAVHKGTAIIMFFWENERAHMNICDKKT